MVGVREWVSEGGRGFAWTIGALTAAGIVAAVWQSIGGASLVVIASIVLAVVLFILASVVIIQTRRIRALTERGSPGEVAQSHQREADLRKRLHVAESEAASAKAEAALAKLPSPPPPLIPVTPAQAAKSALRINTARIIYRRFDTLFRPDGNPKKNPPPLPDWYERNMLRIGENTVLKLADNGHASCAEEVRGDHEEIWHLLQLDIQRRNQEIIDLLNDLRTELNTFENNPTNFGPLAKRIWEMADASDKYLAMAQFIFRSHPECIERARQALEAWLEEHAKLVDSMVNFEPEMEEARYPVGLKSYSVKDFEARPSPTKAPFRPNGGAR